MGLSLTARRSPLVVAAGRSPVPASADPTAPTTTGAQAALPRTVEWRDLTPLTRWEVLYEIGLPLPFLAASLALAPLGLTHHPAWLAAALVLQFVLFLTALRQVHGAFHYTLGLPRWATEWCMFANTIVLLGWMHAIQVTHLLHHRHCLAPDDVEARSATMTWWQSLLSGPCFPFWLLRRAWPAASPSQRRWIAAEVAWNVLALSLAIWPDTPTPLRCHVAAMLLGQCLFPFFGVWTVHHDLAYGDPLARTSRRGWLNGLTFGMFYHLEHHLFPRVPTCHLAAVARRLDATRLAHPLRQVI